MRELAVSPEHTGRPIRQLKKQSCKLGKQDSKWGLEVIYKEVRPLKDSRNGIMGNIISYNLMG